MDGHIGLDPVPKDNGHLGIGAEQTAVITDHLQQTGTAVGLDHGGLIAYVFALVNERPALFLAEEIVYGEDVLVHAPNLVNNDDDPGLNHANVEFFNVP